MMLGQDSSYSSVTTSSRQECDQQVCFNTWDDVSVENEGSYLSRRTQWLAAVLHVALGAALRAGLARVHLCGKAQGADCLLQRLLLRVDVHKHQRLPAPAQAWLHKAHVRVGSQDNQ